MKRKIIACAFIVVCVSIMAYGTVAYFTAQETATNVITAGNIKIALNEDVVSGDNVEAVVFEDVVGIMPASQISKTVKVQNTGDNEAFIRISVHKEITLAEGTTGEIDLSLIGFDLNEKYWTQKDGYYYYNQPLASGKETQPLFSMITFDQHMGNLYQDSKASVKICAQATQTANNGDNVIEAAGWPKE